jgi:hypothetical protein
MFSNHASECSFRQVACVLDPVCKPGRELARQVSTRARIKYNKTDDYFKEQDIPLPKQVVTRTEPKMKFCVRCAYLFLEAYGWTSRATIYISTSDLMTWRLRPVITVAPSYDRENYYMWLVSNQRSKTQLPSDLRRMLYGFLFKTGDEVEGDTILEPLAKRRTKKTRSGRKRTVRVKCLK